jgi:lipoprotein-anchoring transpeptidase ErfK/SrfK
MLKLSTLLAAAAFTVTSLSGISSANALTATTRTASPTPPADVVMVATSRKEVNPKFRKQIVRFSTTEKPGTIIVDTNNKFLYYTLGNNRAIRYGIGVGREGFGWSGVVKVRRKAEWPGWTPPPQMIARERKKGHILPAYMPGGEDNPLGARALYLYNGGGDSGFRIHGTNQPWSIGQNMSSGCIRMMNKDVTDLYERVALGTKVIVVGPGNRQGNVQYDDRGVDILRTLFGG